MSQQNSRCLVIAEAGVNHGGSVARALELVDAAAEAGADIVKFQTFSAEQLVTEHAPKARYQQARTGEGSQLEMLRRLELSRDEFRKIVAHCRRRGIEFLSTPFDEESAAFLLELGCRRLKVSSGDLTHLPFLRALARTGVPLILSTGMATLDEVEDAVEAIATARRDVGCAVPLKDSLVLLHCTSSYPAPLHDVNLRAMAAMAKRFALPVGYSDHTEGILVAPLARALGAVVIEKHLTLDRSANGPDDAASLEPDEFGQMVRMIRDAERVLGSDLKRPAPSEEDVRRVARRSIVLSRTVTAGHVLAESDLVIRRPGTGIQPRHLSEVIGRKMARSRSAGEPLEWEDLTP